MTLQKTKDWYGSSFFKPPPFEICNGQWVSLLHVKESGKATGAHGALVYRIGKSADLFLGWGVPHTYLFTSSNACYAEIQELDYWSTDDASEKMYDKIWHGTNGTSTTLMENHWKNWKVKVQIANRSSPICEFVVTPEC